MGENRKEGRKEGRKEESRGSRKELRKEGRLSRELNCESKKGKRGGEGRGAKNFRMRENVEVWIVLEQLKSHHDIINRKLFCFLRETDYLPTQIPHLTRSGVS